LEGGGGGKKGGASFFWFSPGKKREKEGILWGEKKLSISTLVINGQPGQNGKRHTDELETTHEGGGRNLEKWGAVSGGRAKKKGT